MANRNIFDPDADPKRFKFWMRDQAPLKVYSILFTPRSGSSWLTSILTQTKAMGTPGEWFNPQLMPASSRSKGARNLDEFVEAISRHRAYGSTFGFEVTYHQIKAVFETDANFMARFQNAIFFWLVRKDIIAQGISLDKMVQTQVSHAADHDVHAIERSDDVYSYDGDRIRRWIGHIRAAELGTEHMISVFDLSPVRLTYEEITSWGPQRVVKLFADRLGVEDVNLLDISSDHRKIGTSKNDEFSKRFRAENPEFVRKLEDEREPMFRGGA